MRSDLLLSLEKEYVFRTGDIPPAPDKGCTLDEATVALACANLDITYCMIAKREVSRLYEDIEKAPYTVLFNSGLSALKLWRAVEVMRKLDILLKSAVASKEGKERLVPIHGNRMLLYLVFRKLGTGIFEGDNGDNDMSKIPAIAEGCLRALTEQIMLNYSSSYPAQLFKNITKCKQIASAIV